MTGSPETPADRPGAPARRERAVLFVAYFFPPLGGGGVQRTVKFIKYLRPLGWRSEVVTVAARDYWVSDPTLAADVPADTWVSRTASLTGVGLLEILGGRRRPPAGRPSAAGPARGGQRSTGLFRALRWLSSWFLIPDSYVGWVPFAVRAARRRLRAGGVDVLLTTSSPDSAHLVGLALRRRGDVPWVADFRDPWVRRITFRAPTRLHRWLQTALERRVLETADRVLVTNDATRDDFLARHPRLPRRRFVVIPNGYDPDDLAPLVGARATVGAGADRRPGQRPLRLLHAGLLSGGRTLAPIAAAMQRLFAARADLRGRLILTQLGPRERINDRLVEELGLADSVRFLAPVGHAEVLGAMLDTDALLLLEHGGARGALITPGKLFEYLVSRRPILALVPEGPAAELVRAFGAGEAVDPGRPAAVAAVLTRWVESGPPASGVTDAGLLDYTRPRLAARLCALLDELASKRSAGAGGIS